ncbi:peroxisome assembly protein 26 isoform X1 [Nerophis lumbriciformis]|uniref:peroxisome assembly protein 26 isoform X1 n=1 Tax=Nerophis lumbriciformis TaxID=546530 RepID=UPI002ADF25FA|nr:peroxisome assembly protein 26-like isoform X1 [Nerophis lumbriciformis]
MESPAASGSFAPVFNTALSPSQNKMFNMLEKATEQLMLHKDFQAAFQTCDRGLECLADGGKEEDARGDFKAGFCIVGIQALAELNQWRGVLSWVLQHYQHQEEIPAKILQMCILLYSQVGEPAMMQETTRAWLHCPSNRSVSGFGPAAELYLLHVLLPLGCTDLAREFVVGEVGSVTFTEEQKQTALDIIEEEVERQKHEPAVNVDSSGCDVPTTEGSFLHKLEAMLRLSYRRLMSGSFSFHKLFLAALLLYMLFLRLDPALPSSFMWISKLHQLFRELWKATASLYYQQRATKD